MDLSFSGARYTWSNSRTDWNLHIKEGLGKCFLENFIPKLLIIQLTLITIQFLFESMWLSDLDMASVHCDWHK